MKPVVMVRDLVHREFNMSLLKLKAKVYQYTGIFLAQKELGLYTNSQDFNDEVRRMVAYDDGLPVYDVEETKSLLIGSWEAHYGFYRRMSKHRGIIGWFHVLYLQLKDDLSGQ